VDQQGTHTYVYDDLYRLASVTYPGPSTTSYAFDAFGNRTSMTVAGNTTTYAYDDNDRITSVTPPSPASVINYTWDDNGDLTARGSDSFSWDYEDRMVSATVNSVTTNFTYRGDGLRDSRAVSGGATTTFTWDIGGGLPVILDDGNQYLYGAGLTAQKQSGSWYYYLADGLGSTMAVVNASGAVQDSYTYDVYGTPTKTGSLANEFDFAGQQTDGTGLQYLRARYMDPATGMFMSREPLAVGSRWLGNSTDYAAASPNRFRDPTGLFVTEEGVGGGPTIVTQGDWGLDGDGLWLELYPDSNGKLNLRACGFKTAGGPEIAGVECSSGFFDGGFDILTGEYCSLSFESSVQDYIVACHKRGSDAAPRVAAVAHVEDFNWKDYIAHLGTVVGCSSLGPNVWIAVETTPTGPYSAPVWILVAASGVSCVTGVLSW
jgi:RHS repeat-associated protein